MKRRTPFYKKLLRAGTITLIVGIIFFILETRYYGWNIKPISWQEQKCDIVASALIHFGLYSILFAGWMRMFALSNKKDIQE